MIDLSYIQLESFSMCPTEYTQLGDMLSDVYWNLEIIIICKRWYSFKIMFGTLPFWFASLLFLSAWVRFRFFPFQGVLVLFT